MNKWTFKPIDRDTPARFPACVQDYLPEVHLASFVVEVVEMLDLTAFTSAYKGTGSKPGTHPLCCHCCSIIVVLSLLFYGYTTGVFSSRKLEKATYDSIAFRYIRANNEYPNYDSINTFRKRFRKEISELFIQILMIAKQTGWLKMGTVSLDGTKMKANASKHKALSYKHACKLEKQLKAEVEELLKMAETAEAEKLPKALCIPDELKRREDRLQAIADAKAEIEPRAEERYQQELAEHQEKVARREAIRDLGKNREARNRNGSGANLIFLSSLLKYVIRRIHNSVICKMCSTQVLCPKCGSDDIKNFGYSKHNEPRYFCCNDECKAKSFMLKYRYKAYEPGVKEQVVDMAINGSGIRDTSRVLGINKKTVINTLKRKEDGLVQVNPNIQKMELGTGTIIHVGLVCQEAEIDEQWSCVFKKSNQRWLWYAIDHSTNTVLAYVFGKRKDEVFKKLKKLLEPFGIKKFYTDDWGAYDRHLEENTHIVGKKNTQKIERKNLNFRTWIKRLARKTICFSKLEKMHDLVIGLLINKIEFGIDIHAI